MRSTIFTVWFFSFTFVLAATALVVTGGKGGSDRLRKMLRFHSRSVLWMTRKLMGATIVVRGLEQFENGERPALIVSKHQSELDVFVKLAMFPDSGAIAMQELQRYPLIGPIIRRLDYILVSVESRKQSQLRQVVDGARHVHAQGRPILIYPEGELMRVGSRERYRTGVWHIYDAIGQPAHPVALSTGLVWPQRKWWKRSNATCVVEFMDPIPLGLDKNAFMQEVESRIEARTMQLIEEHGTPEEVAIARERHQLGLTNDDSKSVKQAADAAETDEPGTDGPGAGAHA